MSQRIWTCPKCGAALPVGLWACAACGWSFYRRGFDPRREVAHGARS